MHVVVLGHFVTLVGAIEWTLVYADPTNTPIGRVTMGTMSACGT